MHGGGAEGRKFEGAVSISLPRLYSLVVTTSFGTEALGDDALPAAALRFLARAAARELLALDPAGEMAVSLPPLCLTRRRVPSEVSEANE